MSDDTISAERAREMLEGVGCDAAWLAVSAPSLCRTVIAQAEEIARMRAVVEAARVFRDAKNGVAEAAAVDAMYRALSALDAVEVPRGR